MPKFNIHAERLKARTKEAVPQDHAEHFEHALDDFLQRLPEELRIENTELLKRVFTREAYALAFHAGKDLEALEYEGDKLLRHVVERIWAKMHGSEMPPKDFETPTKESADVSEKPSTWTQDRKEREILQRNSVLSRVAIDLRMNECIRTTNNESRRGAGRQAKMLADSVEAYLFALYQDKGGNGKGTEAAERFVSTYIIPLYEEMRAVYAKNPEEMALFLSEQIDYVAPEVLSYKLQYPQQVLRRNPWIIWGMGGPVRVHFPLSIKNSDESEDDSIYEEDVPTFKPKKREKSAKPLSRAYQQYLRELAKRDFLSRKAAEKQNVVTESVDFMSSPYGKAFQKALDEREGRPVQVRIQSEPSNTPGRKEWSLFIDDQCVLVRSGGKMRSLLREYAVKTKMEVGTLIKANDLMGQKAYARIKKAAEKHDPDGAHKFRIRIVPGPETKFIIYMNDGDLVSEHSTINEAVNDMLTFLRWSDEVPTFIANPELLEEEDASLFAYNRNKLASFPPNTGHAGWEPFTTESLDKTKSYLGIFPELCKRKLGFTPQIAVLATPKQPSQKRSFAVIIEGRLIYSGPCDSSGGAIKKALGILGWMPSE